MAIKPIGGVKRQKGGYPQYYRSQKLVSDIEVVVGKADSFLARNSVVGVRSWKLGLVGAKASTVFPSLEDEIDTVELSSLHAVQEGLDKLFLAHHPSPPIAWEYDDYGQRLPPNSGSPQSSWPAPLW